MNLNNKNFLWNLLKIAKEKLIKKLKFYILHSKYPFRAINLFKKIKLQYLFLLSVSCFIIWQYISSLKISYKWKKDLVKNIVHIKKTITNMRNRNTSKIPYTVTEKIVIYLFILPRIDIIAWKVMEIFAEKYYIHCSWN